MKALMIIIAVTTFTIAVSTGSSSWYPERGNQEDTPRLIIEKVLEAHGGLENWRKMPIVAFYLCKHAPSMDGHDVRKSDIQLEFPTSGAPTYYGIFDSLVMGYDHGIGSAYHLSTPLQLDSIEGEKATYVLPTLNYIWSLPWKLLDPGVEYHRIPDKKVNQEESIGILITFRSNVGETPEDWYRFYFSKRTGRMVAVLFKEHAVENPGIFWLHFEGYKEIEGVWYPGWWKYYQSDTRGKMGRMLKSVELIKVRSYASFELSF